MFSLNKLNNLVERSEEEGDANPNNSPVSSIAGLKSNLAFYWPNLVYQEDNGSLRVLYYAEDVTNTLGWKDADMSSSGIQLSGLAIIPRTPTYSSQSVFYQTGDGYLQEVYSNGFGWHQGKTSISSLPP
jgi:hypothetical protein